MKRRVAHYRLLDVGVCCAAIVCLSVPFLASAFANGLIQTPMTVDVAVRPSATIVQLLDGSNFTVNRNGRSDGVLMWEIRTTDADGYKLSLSAAQSPALRADGLAVNDYSERASGWSVAGDDRRFGFSVRGDDAMAAYSQGALWRGFSGRDNLEVSRHRGGPAGTELTEVLVRSEMGRSWPAGTPLPRAHVISTTTVNL